METPDVIQITRRHLGKLAQLLTGKSHKVQVKTRFTCHMLEVEDLNFHHDSAVLLPDYGTSRSQEGTTDEQERIAGLAVLYACYRHAAAHPQQSALVVGHTDRSGSTSYNQTLSELRAANVHHALRGDRVGWVDVALKNSKVEDYQQILIWLTYKLKWNCDPGGKTNVHDAATKQAVKDFQTQYNERFNASIDTDGNVGRQTWGAFFDVYMLELEHALGTDTPGREQAQQSLRFMTCEAIGCGENFPITPDRTENYKSPVDRRVEILFFDPGEEPALDCRKPGGACSELYEKKMYVPVPIPVTPLPIPSGEAVHVFLSFGFTDPEGNRRFFPEGCPVTVEYTTGESEVQTIGANGVIEFFALRARQGFKLHFQFPAAAFPGGAYLASPDTGATGPEKLLSAADAKTHVGPFFLLPPSFRLADANFDVTGATNYDATTGTFG
ncbi:MAG TPA: peptidoglycan-binding protein, partial [Rhodothermales bacterium]